MKMKEFGTPGIRQWLPTLNSGGSKGEAPPIPFFPTGSPGSTFYSNPIEKGKSISEKISFDLPNRKLTGFNRLKFIHQTIHLILTEILDPPLITLVPHNIYFHINFIDCPACVTAKESVRD